MLGVFLTKDMLFSSRVTAAADTLGAKVKLANSTNRLLDFMGANSPQLVLLDLTAEGVDFKDVIGRLRQTPNPPAIIAYGPHVDVAKLEEARTAGCDAVLTRGEFDRRMSEILQQYLTVK